VRSHMIRAKIHACSADRSINRCVSYLTLNRYEYG
jgi:hypothetical protein